MDNVRIKLLKSLPSHSVGMEIGVWRGDFSQKMLEVVNPAMLHLVDPWEYKAEYPSRWYGGGKAKSQSEMDAIYHNVCGRFKSCNNVYIHRMPSADLHTVMRKESLDWVYIDGNHDFEYVVSDLHIGFGLVKSGGYIAGDDVNWGADMGYPIKKALGRIIAEYNFTDFVITDSQFLIKK